MAGFSTNISNPASRRVQAETRDGPYFQFQANRLTAITTPGSTGAFPVYIDGYSTNAVGPKPYLFFSGYGAEGSGNLRQIRQQRLRFLWRAAVFQRGRRDDPVPQPRHVADHLRGRQRHVRPRRPVEPHHRPGTQPAGSDDQSNFSPRTLGAASN